MTGPRRMTVADIRSIKDDLLDTEKPTQLFYCTCESRYQDKQYGYGVRMFNKCKERSVGHWYRCTACSRLHEYIKPGEKSAEEICEADGVNK